MQFDTQILSSSDSDIKKAGELLRKGSVVAIPTETVYGLGANALDEEAVRKIFKAKGRPQDNPLIVHIGEFSDIYNYVTDVPENALKLAQRFMPGPLTMVLPKKDIIPNATSGGLDTVGIRLPVNKVARAIINESGCPIAAPSANLSGSPSPTTLEHVVKDMSGRIPAIVDGGHCSVGVESTVVCFDNDGKVRLLRPGFVSFEDICDTVGEDNAVCDIGVTEKISEGEKVLSPGMKYKHYSPKADVVIVEGTAESFRRYVAEHDSDGVYAMIFDSDKTDFSSKYITYGDTSEEQARQLFDVLRRTDELGAVKVYARCPEKSGVGLAVYNRLLRAAGFEVIKL